MKDCFFWRVIGEDVARSTCSIAVLSGHFLCVFVSSENSSSHGVIQTLFASLGFSFSPP